MEREPVVAEDVPGVLEALFSHAQVGLAVWDAEHRYRRVNPALAAINGVAPSDHVGRTPTEVLGPELGAQLREIFDRVLAGEALADLEIHGETPAAPGELRTWIASYYPIGAVGAISGIVALVVEVTGERRARSEQQAATALVDAVFAAAPVGVGFWDRELRYRRVNPALARLNGVPAEEHLGRLPSEFLGPLGTAIENLLQEVADGGKPVVDAEVSGEHGGRIHYRQGTIFPVLGPAGELTGVAGVIRDVSAQHEAEAERTRLLRDALTARAQAEAARVRSEAARADADAARRRTEFLSLAGARLAAVTTDYEATLQEVARVAVPAVADWCSFIIVENGELRTVAVSAADPSDEPVAWQLLERYPPRADTPVGAAASIRTGESELIPEIPEELLERIAVDEEHLEFLRRLGFRSAMTVPLKIRGKALGALTLIYSTSGRRYSSDDLQIAESLAARAALSVENARLYAERTHIARTLQRSLLPGALPEVPGVELAAGYRAAGDENEVGGDFYDVFGTPDGAWTVVIGDVVGKGPEAAAVTSLSRHTLRAGTMVSTKPTEILELLNDALLNEPGVDGRFCTVLYARIGEDRRGSGIPLTLATGGHLPPRIVGPDGSLRQLGLRGAIVGGLPNPWFGECETTLEPGELLLLFTDGVTELRGRDPGSGEAALDALLRRMAGAPVGDIVGAVVAQAVELQGGDPRDDVAVIALRALS